MASDFALPTDARTVVLPPLLGPPTSETSTALTIVEPQPAEPASQMQSRRAVAKGDNMVKVADIAEYDGALAHGLRERLDFTTVVNNGVRLTDADAYAVLSPREFERYELIRQGLRDQASCADKPFIVGMLAGIAACFAIPGAYITTDAGSATLFSLILVAGSVLCVHEVTTSAKTKSAQIIENVRAKLRMLGAEQNVSVGA